jgi:hypothetical protein
VQRTLVVIIKGCTSEDAAVFDKSHPSQRADITDDIIDADRHGLRMLQFSQRMHEVDQVIERVNLRSDFDM